MPRLHQKQDGDYFLRTYSGDDEQTGTGYFGTWQIHAMGLDLLEENLCCDEDDKVPLPLFMELLDRRLIWTTSSSRPAGLSHSDDRQLVPLRLRLVASENSWKLKLEIDDRRDHGAAIGRITSLAVGADHVDVRLGMRTRQISSDVTEAINLVGSNVRPDTQKYELVADQYIVDSVQRRRRTLRKHTCKVGVTKGLHPRGSFFTMEGRRLASLPEINGRYYVVLRSTYAWSTTHNRLIPSAFEPKCIGSNHDWECWSLLVAAQCMRELEVFFRPQE